MKNTMRVGIVVPHIFMHRDILPHVIFSPARLALGLAEGLEQLGANATLFSPGPVDTNIKNVTADLSYFEQELGGRGDSYLDLLKKHPFTFISLARQVQSELIARAFEMANNNQLDLVHIYTNEEDIALSFVSLCRKPVVLTHHDPFNFLIHYKNRFPKYKHLNWLSISLAQRAGMPKDTNWAGNIYHGIDPMRFQPNYEPNGDYTAFMGRIIEPKGLHLAITAVKQYNQTHTPQLKLKIAGKHYAGHKKDTYWQNVIEPELTSPQIEYVGFLSSDAEKQNFLGNARALIVPSTFQEPFGMVMIEALACATPIIGLNSGAIPEVINDRQTGLIISHSLENQDETITGFIKALNRVETIDRRNCRAVFEQRFTLERMCQEHLAAYNLLSA